MANLKGFSAISLTNKGVLADATSGSGLLSSVAAIQSMSPALQRQVRNAYKEALRWVFISFIPWTCLALLAGVFLARLNAEAAEHGIVSQSESKESASDGIQLEGVERVAASDNCTIASVSIESKHEEV